MGRPTKHVAALRLAMPLNDRIRQKSIHLLGNGIGLWWAVGFILLVVPAGLGVETAVAQPVLQPSAGAPLTDLTAAQRDRFDFGKLAYMGFIVADGIPASGPNRNGTHCSFCHDSPIGGVGLRTVTHFGRVTGGVFDPLEALGGTLLQNVSNGVCPEAIPPEANVTFERVTPGAMGYGLIEAIPDAALMALEAAPPSPNVSGRAHMVRALEDAPAAPLRVGRFGWKAILPTTLSFSGDAARNELGVTNRLIPTEPAPNGNVAILAKCDLDPDPEDGPGFLAQVGSDSPFIDVLTDFQRFLAAPPQTPRSGMTGEALFMSVGCGDCHVPAFTTADDAALEPALRNQTIRPYADFLLHDMGALTDFPQGDASASEFRTTPLWGLRLRPVALHDGSVARFDFGDFGQFMATVSTRHDRRPRPLPACRRATRLPWSPFSIRSGGVSSITTGTR